MSSADFYCYGPDGRLALIVEARARTATTNTAWATQVRQERLAESPADQQAAFAVVTPAALYVWDPGAPVDSVASYEASLSDERFAQAFGQYVERAGVKAGASVDPFSFGLIVSWWLHDLAERGALPAGYLDDAGIHNLIAGGKIEEREAA